MSIAIARTVLVVALLAGTAAPAAAQFDAGMLASWKDLDTWTRYDDATRRTEVGLGLIPAGPFGTIRVSVEAQLEGRQPSKPPARVNLRLSPPPLLNPNQLRSTTLRFEIDEKRKDRVVFELSDRVLSLDGQPGQLVTSANASLTIEEFERLAVAETVKAEILGIAVEFSAAQLKALRTYADRVMLRSRWR